MKKLFFYAAAAITLVACSDQDYLGNDVEATTSQKAIAFNMKTPATSRAELTGSAAANALGKNFVVVGYKGWAEDKSPIVTDTLVFDHYNVNYVGNTANTTLSNTADWEYVGQSQVVKGVTANSGVLATKAQAQTIKYWDHASKSYDFLGFSLGNGVTVTPASGDPTTSFATATAVDHANLATAAYTLKGTIAQLGECYISDIKTVTEPEYSTAPVTLNFRHLTSKVRMALYETIPGYVIKDVKFRGTLTDVHAPAKTVHADTATFIGAAQFVKSATYTVSYPTTGLDNKANTDYNKAHVAFADTTALDSLKLGVVKYGNVAEDKIDAGTTYLGQTAGGASYCGAGAYTPVMPMENGSKMISIQIDYTLVATDLSGEEIKVYGARADVPAAYTAWKPGYAYTYLFKISQNTNGHTGPDVDDKGLTAISFDAVVANDEVGDQETVTTVATPSITTYGYDTPARKARVNGDEYVAGDSIFATVQTASGAVAATKLYTVTIEADAAQTINEASVANCIANGTYDSSAKTYTVKDANDKKLVVTETTGVAAIVDKVWLTKDQHLDIDALAWVGVAGTTYVVEYEVSAPSFTYDEGTVLTAGTSLDTYYIKISSDEYEACASTDTADGSTKYYKKVNVPGVYAYKVVKVN